MSEKKAKLSTKLHAGRKKRHGGFAYLVSGKLPDYRRYVEQYLTAAREGLISDLGGSEEGLTTAQIILIDRVISKIGILRCLEEFCFESGVMKGEDLNAPLKASYLAYSNSLRLDLQSLGIDKHVNEALDLQTYLEKKGKTTS